MDRASLSDTYKDGASDRERERERRLHTHTHVFLQGSCERKADMTANSTFLGGSAHAQCSQCQVGLFKVLLAKETLRNLLH